MAGQQQVTYGGQAVMEGVMMRGPREMAIAVRTPDGSIVTEKREINMWTVRWQKIPVLRGVAALLESLTLGISALMYSAEKSSSEAEQIGTGGMVVSMMLAFALAVGLFMLLPTFLIGLVRNTGLIEHPIALNLCEGGTRLLILVSYIYLVSRLEDIGRVFEYHGAEHKVIKAHETGSLSSENISKQSTQHVRCGTSFLLFVVVISVLLFSMFGWPNVFVRAGLRLLLLPVIAGLSYELIRFAGRSQSSIVKALVAPGLLMQRLTTREPDSDQIEVALTAFNMLIEKQAPADSAMQ